MAKQDYDNLKQEVAKLNPDVVGEPQCPVSVALQEGENLYAWCQEDKNELIRIGMDWNLVTSLPARLGATRYIQSEWQKEFQGQEDAQRQWKKESPVAFDMFDELAHHFAHAFHFSPDLLSKTQRIAENKSTSSMIQGLSDLSVLGKANQPLLQKIGFKMEMLDQAAVMSDKMAKLYALSNEQRQSGSQVKVERDRYYSYMKIAVDEIRRNGQYLHYRNEARKKGYVSAYFKKNRSTSKPDDTTED